MIWELLSLSLVPKVSSLAASLAVGAGTNLSPPIASHIRRVAGQNPDKTTTM
jgi:hypothetical protein